MTEHSKDYYSIIGVPRDANDEEIKRAYRLKARQYHPDMGGSTAEMRQLNEAYKILLDPAARRTYDLSCNGENLFVLSQHTVVTPPEQPSPFLKDIKWFLIQSVVCIFFGFFLLGTAEEPQLMRYPLYVWLMRCVGAMVFSLGMMFVYLLHRLNSPRSKEIPISTKQRRSRAQVLFLIAVILSIVVISLHPHIR